MESIVLIVTVLVLVWYFGSVINNTVKGTSEMASKEFELLKDEQEVRIAKSYNDLGKRLQKVIDEADHTRGSVKGLIKVMNKEVHPDEEEEK